MEKNYENIIYGKNLKDIRKKKNLTQDRVAQMTGLEAKYISQIECGITKGSINTMLKLCKIYNVTPNDVLHQFININKPNKKIKKMAEDISKLTKRDKEIVLSLIEILLAKKEQKRTSSKKQTVKFRQSPKFCLRTNF